MNEFESNSDAWNREWKFEAWNRECRSSNQVRCFESEMEEFEPDSDYWNREWRSSSPIPTIGIGNGGVQVLELGMEEFEPSSRLGFGN